MGVVNVTPDSFSDGGLYFDAARAVAHARVLVDEGADILDIGGESTRPGSEGVSVDEELRRLRPVVTELVGATGVPVSVDTMKPEVADECLRLGARIINDVDGLRNPEMLATVARHHAAAVVMHMRGVPKTMQNDTAYEDVVADVCDFLAGQLEAARAAGIRDVAVDPGLGFGKTGAQCVEILQRLDEFQTIDAPLLIGPSRKAFLGRLTGEAEPARRVEATLAAVVISAMKGAAVVRVHDVAACRRALIVADAVRCA